MSAVLVGPSAVLGRSNAVLGSAHERRATAAEICTEIFTEICTEL